MEDMHKQNAEEMDFFHPVESFLTINGNNLFEIDGSDTNLGTKICTPVYVLSENRVRNNYGIWWCLSI